MTAKEIEQTLSSFPGEWDSFLSFVKEKEYFLPLIKEITKRYQSEVVFPKAEEVYRAFSLVNPEDVKLVIIGQDPYIQQGQANGLAFSVRDGVRIPPSLLNIYKELNYEYGYPISTSGDLSSWASQGVLLLNACLTVEEGKASSHAKLGWFSFTEDVLTALDSSGRDIVYLLWGNFAKERAKVLTSKHAHLIYTAHPSPLSASRGFFHSDCFKKVNETLKELGLEEIDFKVDDGSLFD